MTRKILRWAAIALAAFVFVGEASARSLSGAYLMARQAAQRNDLNAAAKYFSAALSMDPSDDQLRAQAMTFAVMSGDMKLGVTLARALGEPEFGNQLAVVLLIIDDIAANRLESARDRLTKNGDAFEPLPPALLMGWVAHGLGDANEAAKAFATLDATDGFSMFGKHHFALSLAARGEHERADVLYQAAADLANGRTSRMARAHGATLEALGRQDDARALYMMMVSSGAGDQTLERALAGLDTEAVSPLVVRSAMDGVAEVMFDLAEGLSQNRRYSVALIYAQIARYLRPDMDEAILLVANMLQAQEQHTLAIEAFEEIAQDSPFIINATIGRADALRDMDRKEEALAALTALSAEFPTVIQAQIALAEVLRVDEHFAEAATAYSTAIALVDAPGARHWSLFYQRGISRERSGRWDEAEADFRKALELMPDQPMVLNYLGYSLVEKRRHLDEAQQMIEKAVEQRPDDGYIADSLGWVLYRLGKYDEAVEKMEMAVELMPVDPIINDHLGDVLWKVGRRLEAEFQWKRALSFEPSDEEATRIREKLARGLDAVLEDEAAEAASSSNGETNGG